MRLLDTLHRPLRSLRISVTDRCNLRCAYCMPEEEYTWLPREDLLTFEEIGLLAGIFAGLGVGKVRLTGGEPLLRRDLPVLLRGLAAVPGIRDLSLTTNGTLLADQARTLQEAGLGRVTVSLDTLRPDRFRDLTRQRGLSRVLEGIEAAARAGFRALKLNTVVVRGVNEDEIADLIEFGRMHGAEIRFIEYMDVGGATRWSPEKVVPREEILRILAGRYGEVQPTLEKDRAPAARFVLPDGTRFGIIASTTSPFCRSCDRSRLTADGMWFLCLYAARGLDLRRRVRDGATAETIAAEIARAWGHRADRGAEERFGLVSRGALLPAESLREDPHLEMHTRGG